MKAGTVFAPFGAFFALALLAGCGGGGDRGGPLPVIQGPPPQPVVSQTPTEFARLATAMEVDAVSVTLHDYTEFDLAATTVVTIDGQPAVLSSFRPGDVVLTRGTGYLDTAGNLWLGNAPLHSFDAQHQVVGPVDLVDPAHGRLVVMGQTVDVTGQMPVDGTTVAAGGLGGIEVGALVSVSGYRLADGSVIATNVTHGSASGGLVLRGFVAQADPANHVLFIGDLELNAAAATFDPNDFPSGVPGIGEQVLVFADAVPMGGILAARQVQLLPRNLSAVAGTQLYVEGAVTRFATSTDFDVAGVRAACSGGGCAAAAQALQSSRVVAISGLEGADGVVQATEIGDVSNFLGGATYALSGPITANDQATGALTVLGFQVQPSRLTTLADNVNPVAPPGSLGDLKLGDRIAVEGTYGGVPGLLIAVGIARDAGTETPFLTAFVPDLHDPAINFLGRAIATSAATKITACGALRDSAYLFNNPAINALYITVADPTANPMQADGVTVSTTTVGC